MNRSGKKEDSTKSVAAFTNGT
jgi:hypothetical protein